MDNVLDCCIEEVIDSPLELTIRIETPLLGKIFIQKDAIRARGVGKKTRRDYIYDFLQPVSHLLGDHGSNAPCPIMNDDVHPLSSLDSFQMSG